MRAKLETPSLLPTSLTTTTSQLQNMGVGWSAPSREKNRRAGDLITRKGELSEGPHFANLQQPRGRLACDLLPAELTRSNPFCLLWFPGEQRRSGVGWVHVCDLAPQNKNEGNDGIEPPHPLCPTLSQSISCTGPLVWQLTLHSGKSVQKPHTKTRSGVLLRIGQWLHASALVQAHENHRSPEKFVHSSDQDWPWKHTVREEEVAANEAMRRESQ